MLHGADGEVETVVEDQAVRLGRRREGRKHLGRGTRLSGRSSVRASWRDVTRKSFVLSLSFSLSSDARVHLVRHTMLTQTQRSGRRRITWTALWVRRTLGEAG